MALTATATRETHDCIMKRLTMQTPKVIGLSPERDNIKFCVRPAPTLKDTTSFFHEMGMKSHGSLIHL